MPFQPTNFPALFNGDITAITVTSPFPESTLVVDRRDNYTIQVNWFVSGMLAPATSGTRYRVEAFLESMGGGFEGKVGELIVLAGNPGPGVTNYVANIVAPPANLNAAHTAGAYKLVVTVNNINGLNNPTGIAGYIEGQILQFVDEP